MYIIFIKDLKSINGVKFHIIISTAKYIIAIKNKTQVIRKNPVFLYLLSPSGNVFIFLNETHMVVSLIFLQQNPSGTIFVLSLESLPTQLVCI